MRSVLGLLLLVGALGCADTPPTPERVVLRYFDTIGRDPMRTLNLLSPAYHESHGLEVAALEGWSWGNQVLDLPEALPNPDLAPLDATRGPDSAQLAWVMVQLERHFRRLVHQVKQSIVHEVVVGNRATVEVAVLPPAGLRFTQRFRLSRRNASAPWRIDSIDQEGVVPREIYVAFAMSPREETRQKVIARLNRGGIPQEMNRGTEESDP